VKCLRNVQYPALEKLEEEHLSLLKERFDIAAGRRTAEDEDDLSLFLGQIPQPASVEQPKASRQERSTARLIRRIHRRQVGADLAAEEGFSTDSSLSSDQEEDFQLAITKLKEKAEDILNDVRAGEFRDPSQGLGKWFREWKEKYEDIYVGAWGGLGLVGAWEFWARLEILGWNPFQVSGSHHHLPRSCKGTRVLFRQFSTPY
jgi:GC-rich sequence DNA-binding factor